MHLVSSAPDPSPTPDAPGVLLAPDSFGGWRSSVEVARKAQALLANAGVSVEAHPMSDGGEGLVEALLAHRPGVVERVALRGAAHQGCTGTYARAAGATVVESASALGLHERGTDTPLEATSFSLGVLLCAAARKRTGSLIVGLGGTATLDGGLGFLQALGVQALDAQGGRLPAGGGAEQLFNLARLEGTPRDLGMLEVWCDVATPLGEAPRTFGPQKGLLDADRPRLESALGRFVEVVNDWRRRRGLATVSPDLTGGGAAGGLGFALAALDATLRPGAEAFADQTGLDTALSRAHTVVLGEGRLDATSFAGKVASAVTQRARLRGVRVGALVGQAQDVPDRPWGPDFVVEAGEAPNREEAFALACRTLADRLRRIR